MKKKYFFKRTLKPMDKLQIKKVLEEEVFSNPHFIDHVKQVSHNTKFDEEIVKEVLKNYITNVFTIMSTIQKIKTKINLYGFLTIFIEPGRRI